MFRALLAAGRIRVRDAEFLHRAPQWVAAGTSAEWRRSQVDAAGEERNFLTDFAGLGDFPPGTEGDGPVAALAVEN